MILLTYVTKRLQKAQHLELTVFISSVIDTGSVVILWIGLHTSSYGFFFWHLETDTSLFLLSLCWRLYDLIEQSCFIGFWSSGVFCLLWRNFQLASIQCFALPCHCCGHSCGRSWLCFVTPGTDYSSPMLKVLKQASWQPHQVHSMPLKWHKENKKFPNFFPPLQPSVCYFYLLQLLQEEAVLPLWTAETCS